MVKQIIIVSSLLLTVGSASAQSHGIVLSGGDINPIGPVDVEMFCKKSELLTCQSDLTSCQQDVQSAQDEIDNATQQLNATLDELNNIKDQLAELEEQNSSLSDQIASLENTINDLEGASENLEPQFRDRKYSLQARCVSRILKDISNPVLVKNAAKRCRKKFRRMQKKIGHKGSDLSLSFK